MNDACDTFGFPFEGVKSCREADCRCTKFKEKKWGLKKTLTEEERNICMDCKHAKDKHYVLETYIYTVNSINIYFDLVNIL